MGIGWAQARVGRVERAVSSCAEAISRARRPLGGQEVGGCRECVGQTFYGSEGYYVEGCRGEGLGAGVLYIDVRQCKGTGYFVEEGGFLVVGFD